MDRSKEISKKIKLYGRDILSSEEFRRARTQVHHYRTSLAAHSILTARIGLGICEFLRKCGISVDERKVVRIALLHDLGMVGRHEKYRNNYECGYMHPIHSAESAGRIWKDIDEDSVKAIKSHMWPLSLRIPTSWEGVVLCIADKRASFLDVTSILFRHR